MVLATQNPVEHHGTYPLPESQLDRFLMRIRMGYPEPGKRETRSSKPLAFVRTRWTAWSRSWAMKRCRKSRKSVRAGEGG